MNCNSPFHPAQQAKFMTIEDVAKTANALAEEYGEDTRERYLSQMFDGLHELASKKA